jgi:hypothetical protein
MDHLSARTVGVTEDTAPPARRPVARTGVGGRSLPTDADGAGGGPSVRPAAGSPRPQLTAQQRDPQA